MRLDPREYLRNSEFKPKVVEEKYPNARRRLTSGLFIAHSGLDFLWIRKEIIHIISAQFYDSYFLHNKESGGSEDYKQIVQAALHFCDKFMVIISANSVKNSWVPAEVEWAVGHKRPIIQCRLDDSDPSMLHPALARTPSWRIREKVFTADFRINTDWGRAELANILSKRIFIFRDERFKK